MSITDGPLESRPLRGHIAEAIRAAGIEWHRSNDPKWRDKPWMDGVSVDLDEDDQLTALTDGVCALLAQSELWAGAGDLMTGLPKDKP